MNRFSKVPFGRFLFFLVLGIAIERVIPQLNLWCFVLPSVLCFSLSYLLESRFFSCRILFGIGLSIGLISIGMYRMRIESLDNTKCVGLNSLQHSVLVQLHSPPIEKKKSIFFEANVCLDSINGSFPVYLYLKKDSFSSNLVDGDWIGVSSSVKKMNGDSSSDYQQYLSSKGVDGSYYVGPDQWFFIHHSVDFSFKRNAHSIQKKIVGIFQQYGIVGDELGVLSALTIGDKTLLNRELKNSYSEVGASHILAVSGLHVGVVFFVFSSVLSFFMKNRRLKNIRIISSLIVLWIFTFVTGLSPSVIRAAIMLTMASISGLLGRKAQIFNTVFASAFLMLLYSPRYLTDLGFQLSYSAVISILLFHPILEKAVVTKNYLISKIWTLLSVSFSAQLGTLPISLYYFHQTSNLFWLSGFVVIPMSAILIYLSISLWCLHFVPCIGNVISTCLQWLAHFMNESVRWMETWNGGVCQNVAFELIDLIFISLYLVMLYLFVRKQSFKRITFLLLVLLSYSLYRFLCTIFLIS